MQQKTKQRLQILLALALFPVPAGIAFGAIGTMTRHEHRDPCADRPADRAAAEGLDVPLPAGAQVCAASGGGGSGAISAVVAEPSFVCTATLGTVDCPSLPSLTNWFAAKALDRGWDTGAVTTSTDDAVLALSRPGTATGSVRLHRDRYGEVRVDFLVFGAAKKKKLASAED